MNRKQTFKRRLDNTKSEMTQESVSQQAQTRERELSPTEKEIQRLQRETNRQIAELKATGTMADLVKYIKESKQVEQAKLYIMAKVFTNYVEWTKRQDPNYVPSKRGRKKVKA